MVEREQLASKQLDATSGDGHDLDAQLEQTDVPEADSVTNKVVKTAGNKRPFSASLTQDAGGLVGMRPKTAGENVRPKSVRFADENKKLAADSTDEGETNKSRMNKSKTSCRPASEGSSRFDDHDDPGDSGHGDSHRYPQASKSITTSGSSHPVSGSGKFSSDGQSKSAAGAATNEKLSETTWHYSDDKELVLARPKSATVLFETGSGLSIEEQRDTAVMKAQAGVKSSRYKQKKAQSKDQSSTIANVKSNNEIQNLECRESHGDSQKDIAKETEKFKQDVPPYISHLPPRGSKSQGHQAQEKALKKPFLAKVRPTSASAYINNDVVESKTRVTSAGRAAAGNIQIFAERTSILGRHGMLGKKRPFSAPSCTSGHSKNTAAPSRPRPRSSNKSKVHSVQGKCKPCKNNLRRSSTKALSKDGATDADKMWEELPTDDDFSDDLFLSKFDQLDKELELSKAELHAETFKYSLPLTRGADRMMGPDDGLELEVVTDKLPTTCPVIIPGEDDVTQDDVEDLSECNIPSEPDAAAPDVDFAELSAVTTISASLYKKTNLFVPVSKRGLGKPRQDTRNSSASNRFTVDEAADCEANGGGDSSDGKVGNLGEECVTDKVIEDLQQTAASLLNGECEIEKDAADVIAVEERIEEVRRQLEVDYPHLMKLNQDKVACGHVAEDHEVKCSHGGGRRASDAESMYQGDLYTSLLKAYRHRFTESGHDNSDDDDLDEGIITKSKKMQLHEKAERSGGKCLGRDSQQRSAMSAKNAGAKTRPLSGTTNDSGLESDVPSNEDDESDNMVCKTSGVTHQQMKTDVDLPTKNETKIKISSEEVQNRENGNWNQQTTADDCVRETKLISALEIVAEAKKLSKPRMKPRHKEEMSTLSRVPPLCFRLNAKPPSGYLFYFAYDQNMSMDRMMAYLGVEKPPVCFWALLFGFELVFNKRAEVNSDPKEVGGFPNLIYNANSSVEGCLYQLTPGQLECLDKFMDYPHNCEHVVLPVWMSNCCSPEELGVAQYCVPACTYIARDEATWAEPVQPNEFALAQCIKAADLLTPAYRDHLTLLETSKTSPDETSMHAAPSSVCVN